MNRKRLSAVLTVLIVGAVYFIQSDSDETYSRESALKEMTSVVDDLRAWRDASGTYIGGPRSGGVMLAAGDTIWGASKRFKTDHGEVCVIAGDLGSGSKVSVATEDKPCSDEGVRELQEYICQVEGKQETCPET